MPITRRQLLILGAAATLAFSASPALADSWRLSSMMTPDSPEGKAYTKFAELVKQYTNGKLEIRVYPNEQLGKSNAVTEQLSAGTIQLSPSSATFLSKWVPDINYISAPFVFENWDHWARFMDTDLVKGWLQEVAKKSGITVLGKISDFPRGSYRVLVSKKPIKTLDDLKNLKVRQFSQELVVDVWNYLGAEVRVMGWSDVYDGLNRGIIEAATGPVELIEDARMYEVAPYIVRTDEYPQAVAFMMNKKAYDALDPALQAGLLKAHREASAYEREILKTSASESLKRMEAKGAKYSEDLNIKSVTSKMWEFYKARAAAGKLPKGFIEAVDATRGN